MQQTPSNPETVVAPNGQYSQAVSISMGAGRLIFVSGQVALDQHGVLVGAGDMAAQADQVFQNLQAVLEANQASLTDVVKVTVFVTDMSRREEVAEVRRRYFRSHAPASTFVEVSSLDDPAWLVEIEVIAAPTP